MSSRSKKIAEGTASVLLGTGIMMGANVRPVKAAGSREDEITEVETANVLSNEKASVRIGVKQIAKDTQTEQLNTNETAADVAESNEVQITTQSDDVVNEGAVQGSETTSANNTQAASTEGISEQQASSDNQQISNSVGESDNNGADVNPQTNQASNSGGLVGANEKVTADNTRAGDEDHTAIITPKPGESDSENKAEEANTTEREKLETKVNELLEKVKDLEGATITPTDPNTADFNANVDTLNSVISKLSEYTDDQISKLETAINKFITDLNDYNTNKAAYEKFMADLEKYGLYNKESDINPDKLTQDLVFGKETNAKVEIDSLDHNYVTIGDKNQDADTMKFLNHFVAIKQDVVEGDIFKLIYTDLNNTSYNGEKITKLELTFSGWEHSENYKSNKGKPAGIYFSNDPSKGFWYVNTKGVTMEMVLYSGEGENQHVVTLGDNAYVVLNSMNSEGNEGAQYEYIEKAQIINGSDYSGYGVALPESAVNIHDGSSSGITGGGDILYADEYINLLAKTGNLTDSEKQAIKRIWGEEKGQFLIDNYSGWDATPDDKNYASLVNRKIFATGMFKVSGNRIKIRFSNNVNAGWSTYSSQLPSLNFKAEQPTANLTYTPGEIVMDKSSVTIHYIDVNGLSETEYEQNRDANELIFQEFNDLCLNGTYSISNLWNWEAQGYKLVKQDNLENFKVIDGTQDLYIYLDHKTKSIHRDGAVEQVIHYRVKGNDSITLKDDYKATLTYGQDGIHDLVDDVDIWDSEWKLELTFAGVDSDEVIDHYHLVQKDKDKTVGPISVIVNTSNFDNPPKQEYTVYYTNNQMSDVSRNKVVHQVIEYKAEDGTDLGYAKYEADLTFTQTGKIDTYTQEYIWDGEWTPKQSFTEVLSPKFINNYHLKNDSDASVGPFEIEVTNDNCEKTLDKNYVVLYVPNEIVDAERKKEVHQTIHYYVDGTTEKLKDDYTATLVFTQTGKWDKDRNTYTWDGDWTQTETFAAVKSDDIIDRYHLKFEIDKNVAAIQKTVTNANFNDDGLDEEYTVYYVANPTETVYRDKTVTETIHYVYGSQDGDKVANDYVATLTCKQDGIKDTLNANMPVIWNTNWGETLRFDAVTSPQITNCHTETIEVKIQTVTVTNDTFGNDQNIEIYVIYVANGTETKQETNEVHRVVHYVDEEGNEIHTPSDEATIVFERDIVVDAVDGRTISIGEWRPKTTNAFDAVESPDITNWVLKDEKDKTAGAHTDVKAESGTIHDYVVYVHDTETISRDKTMTQTIHYVYENGDPAHEDYTVTLTFTQTGVRDKVTGVETWDENWTQTQTFQTKGSPEIAGYTADKKEVGPYEITVNDGNFGENLDKEDTVTYKVNSVTPDPGTDPNPDPQPTVPDPTPTPTPDPERPLPEEPTNPSNPAEDDNENHDNDENPSSSSHKVETNRSDTNNGKVGSIADTTKSDKQTSPQNLSNNNGGTDQVKTNVKQDDQATLPATGEKEDDVAKLMSGLSAALGLTGLVAASRRRKVTAKRNRKNKKHGK